MIKRVRNFHSSLILFVAFAVIASWPLACYADSAKADLFLKTNQYRKQNGAQPLSIDSRLETAAQNYAKHLAAKDKFDHNVGSTLGQRLKQVGYEGAAAENLFQTTGSNIGYAIKAWSESSGHRRNMRNKSWRKVGFGIAKGKGKKTIVVAVYGR